MRLYLLWIGSMLLSWSLLAQQPTQNYQLHQHTDSDLDYYPCATPSVRNEWMRQYQQNPVARAAAKSSANTIYLPLTFHLVGYNNGTGHPDLNTVLNAFCRVNQDYASTNIQFYIQFPINYIDNSLLNDHDSIYQGGGLMAQYNVPNTTNCYFVTDPAGACGYNVLYGGLTVNKNCLARNTFSHELGHALGLQHTFFGWEGGQSYNGISQRVFNAPAPDYVLYDYTVYKDTFWGPDTIIVDTAEVERVARTGSRANCYTAADGFCDTPPDYLAFGWYCNSNGNGSIRQFDPDGVRFFSNGANMMSYSRCRAVFSTEQGNGMRAFVQANRSSHIGRTPNRDSISSQNITFRSPTNNAVLTGTTGHTFRWNAVPGATHYLLRICRSPCNLNSQLVTEVVLTDTFYTTTANLQPRASFLPYRWRITPFNESYTCAAACPYYNFNTQLATSTTRLPEGPLQCTIAPNPSRTGQPLYLTAQTTTPVVVNLALYSVAGQVVHQQQWNITTGEHQLGLSTKVLPPGVYWLKLAYGNEQSTHKIIIQP